MSLDNSNYYSDHRVRAGYRRADSPIESVDESKMLARVRLLLEDTSEEIRELPVSYVVCPTCDGRGKHVNPSIDSGGLSSDDFDDDPEFRESYMRGFYDVTCYECRGKRVAPYLDRSRIDAGTLALLDGRAASDAAFRAEVEAERRMGA